MGGLEKGDGMKNIIGIKPGDIFCTENPMQLGKIIKWGQTFNSVDGCALMTHTGIIMNRRGRTFECLTTVRSENLYEMYGGKNCLIGRHRGMTQKKFLHAFSLIFQKYHGGQYPYLRLPLMALFPRLSKYLYWGRPVCSELVFKMLYEANLVGYWKGVSPDHIADCIRTWRDFKIIYDGILPKLI